MPKNILMIGPTGCGKTEIARRLAKLADAPFVKVEATKYTEVGFHGRDVDQIIRDLLDNAIVMVKQRIRAQLRDKVAGQVERRIVEALTGADDEREVANFRDMYRAGQLDETEVELELPMGRSRGAGGLSIMPIMNDNPQVGVCIVNFLSTVLYKPLFVHGYLYVDVCFKMYNVCWKPRCCMVLWSRF